MSFLWYHSQNKLKKLKKDSNRAKWNQESTTCLLSTYKKYCDIYDAGKLTYDKLWRSVHKGMQDGGYDFTITQCSNKLDQLKRKYKEVMDNNAETGKNPITCEFFNELHEMYHKNRGSNH